MTPQTFFPQNAKDGKLLHFLKECPAWIILCFLLIIFLGYYHVTRDDFVPRIIDNLVGAVLATLVGVASKNFRSGDFRAGAVDESRISADTVNLVKEDTKDGMVDKTNGA